MSNQNITENETLDILRQKLAGNITRWTQKTSRLETAIPGLLLTRYEETSDPATGQYEPSICLVAQGAKRILLNEEEYIYDANNFLITAVGLPVVYSIIEASREVPLLGVVLQLDLRVAAELMLDNSLKIPATSQSSRGMTVSRISAPLLGSILRMIELLDSPDDIQILAPLIQKEILYRLLLGEQGAHLRQIVSSGSQSSQIARAISWLRGNYTQALKIDDLARQVGMSTSTFHHHFRTLTAMSPLQYLKMMRLNEARRLMIMERLDATSAAFEVGYESPSQFSREYRRQFGSPPMQDIKNLQQMGMQ